MSRIFLLIIFLFSLNKIAIAKDNVFLADDLFFIDQMNSHNKNFALYFKGREKSILARGETENYINDYPKDLYIYDYKTKTSSPLISYEWFPSRAKYYLEEYDFPVFPDDFAYYLLKDNKQNHLEILESHILLNKILHEMETTHMKLMEMRFSFYNHRYKDLLDNH